MFFFLPEVTSVKDVGITFDTNLSHSLPTLLPLHSLQTSELIYYFVPFSLEIQAFLSRHILPMLDLCLNITVIWSPYKVGDIFSIEKVQRSTSWSQKLNIQATPSCHKPWYLELRRLRTDLVVCYKIVFGLIKVDVNKFFSFAPVSNTRGHRYKLFVEQSTRNVRHYVSVDELSIYGIICRPLLTLPPWLNSNVVTSWFVKVLIVLCWLVRLFFRMVVSALSSHSTLACHVFCYILLCTWLLLLLLLSSLLLTFL